jgi:hypothetical protein
LRNQLEFSEFSEVFHLADFKRQLLPIYSDLKRQYKKLCKSRKLEYTRKKEERILKEAENNKCYKILKLSKSVDTANNIQLNEWEDSFDAIFNEKKYQ